MKRSLLINSLIIFIIFVIAIAALFVIQSIYPIRNIPPLNGTNGGMQFDLDAPFPIINDTSTFGSPDRAYDDLVKGVNVIKTSTVGHNVKITGISTGFNSDGINGPDLPVYIFNGYFNDTGNKEQYTAYVVSPVYAFQGYYGNGYGGQSSAFVKVT